MKQLNLFVELTRLKRPIGYMLLFWPCLWGLTIAYDFKNHTKIRENKNFIAISLLALAYVASFQKEVQAPPYSSF